MVKVVRKPDPENNLDQSVTPDKTIRKNGKAWPGTRHPSITPETADFRCNGAKKRRNGYMKPQNGIAL